MGILINYKPNPYETTRIQWKVRRCFFFAAHVGGRNAPTKGVQNLAPEPIGSMGRLYLRQGQAGLQNAWRDEVAAGRHDGSLDALLSMELPEDFVFSQNLRDTMCKFVPGIKNL